jgi:hypothetical protein
MRGPLALRALEEIVRLRRSSSVLVRPLNFTVRELRVLPRHPQRVHSPGHRGQPRQAVRRFGSG